MIKVVVTKRNPTRRKRTLVVRHKKFRAADGTILTAPSLDSGNPEFGLTLEKVFRTNVRTTIKQFEIISRALDSKMPKRGLKLITRDLKKATKQIAKASRKK